MQTYAEDDGERKNKTKKSYQLSASLLEQLQFTESTSEGGKASSTVVSSSFLCLPSKSQFCFFLSGLGCPSFLCPKASGSPLEGVSSCYQIRFFAQRAATQNAKMPRFTAKEGFIQKAAKWEDGRASLRCRQGAWDIYGIQKQGGGLPWWSSG